ncbi:MAG: IclR family transcriptional regulator [Victivallales bacterium]|jgi:DNA-binding IclR family transcriptional regulator
MKNTTKKNSRSRYQVPNLERALSIMEHLASRPECSTMAEIARTLKYPNNSVFRIVSTLEDLGYLAKETEGNNYSLTRKLLSLGYQALIESSLIEKSLDVLRSMRDDTGETALIGALLEGEGVVLEQILSREAVKFMVTPGARFNLHTAAPGKAILAFLDEKERERQIALIKFKKFNSQTITSAECFREELQNVRKSGFATDLGEEASGIICAAAPVFDYRGSPVASIWITGPEFRLKKKGFDKICKIVESRASCLSERMGYSPAGRKMRGSQRIS